MATRILTAEDAARFNELSRWAESWLKDDLPRFSGIDPRTGDTRDLAIIEDRIRADNSAGWLKRLGEHGPPFCDAYHRVRVRIESQPFVARLGFIADEGVNLTRTIGERDSRGPERSYRSGHAAAAAWIEQIGAMLFGPEPWHHAVENGSSFPTDGRSLDVMNDWWQRVSEAGSRWTIRDVSSAMQRVCWMSTGVDAQGVFDRMEIEREKLVGSAEIARTTEESELSASEKKRKRIELVRGLCREQKLSGQWAALAAAANENADINALGLESLTRETVRGMCRNITHRQPARTRKSARKS